MIAHLKGVLLEKTPQEAVIDVGGVGYRVLITLNGFEKLPEIGEEAKLHTATIAREDALNLYGFAEREEKAMFLQLITVTRIGPKLACSILSGVKVEKLRSAIVTGDKAGFGKIPGVGPKTAERIIMDLKDKFGAVAGEAATAEGDGTASDAVAALVNLGYARTEAHKAVGKIVTQDGEAGLGDVIRKALKELSS